MKLLDIKEIKGTIALKSGLHIGSGDNDMSIGGTDNPVVRHPFTKEPYIPGSSLKGKIRSLLEMKYGLMGETEGAPVKIGDLKKFKEDGDKKNCKKILKLFGSGASSDEDDQQALSEIGPTRLSFADCPLNEKFAKRAKERHMPFFEVKSENTIDRIKGTARDPRTVERVPAGVIFDFSVSIKHFEQDDYEGTEKILRDGIQLLESDALGGSGSRGYGRVTFDSDDLKKNDK
ncbi:conserved hypothetical protein [Candidatus Desulfarcum epimagneticum]|uniref:CRISPR system Cms endoribonuclease Csm3 n=1 Tax=uncultured Desulfobacteraceae bacterium TaxID=218296 RepID=A0A484HIF5_9BACT|nr:conserved hypothetical protein [uncultured Desulfobacteraceae bacterium]